MKTIGLIVAMLFSVTSWGATPATTGLPGLSIAGQFYTKDLIVVSCGMSTGGLESTCFFPGTGAMTQDDWATTTGSFRIVAARITNLQASANNYYCIGMYDSSDPGGVSGSYFDVNGTGAQNLFWFYNRDCQGGGTEGHRSLFVVEPDGSAAFSIQDFANLNIVVPINKRIMATYTGSNGATTMFLYGYYE